MWLAGLEPSACGSEVASSRASEPPLFTCRLFWVDLPELTILTCNLDERRKSAMGHTLRGRRDARRAGDGCPKIPFWRGGEMGGRTRSDPAGGSRVTQCLSPPMPLSARIAPADAPGGRVMNPSATARVEPSSTLRRGCAARSRGSARKREREPTGAPVHRVQRQVLTRTPSSAGFARLFSACECAILQ